jgi:transcriptional regulator with XRE-family HTH domain
MSDVIDWQEPTPVGKKPQDKNSDDETLRRNLQRLIEERGTNAQSVSAAAGRSASWVSEFLRGKSHNPALSTIRGLADALGTNVASLLEEEPSGQSGVSGDTRRIPHNLAQIPVIGMADTGAYRVTDDAVRCLISGPTLEILPHAKPFALEIRDVAMDAAKPNPLLIGFDALCVDLRAESLVVESGNIYAVRRAQRGVRGPRTDETIIRRAQVFRDRVELTAETNYRGPGKFEKIIVPGKLTTDPKQPIYAFGLVYCVLAPTYKI